MKLVLTKINYYELKSTIDKVTIVATTFFPLTLGTNNNRRVKVEMTLNEVQNNAYLAWRCPSPTTNNKETVIKVMRTTL